MIVLVALSARLLPVPLLNIFDYGLLLAHLLVPVLTPLIVLGHRGDVATSPNH